MVLVGLLVFTDPPRAGARVVLAERARLGIRVVVITGDDPRVAAHVWEQLASGPPAVVGADELRALSAEALERRCADVQIFAEVEPTQKERIVHALRQRGHVVAYLGDGINDAPALRAADVGITVDGASDVAREAADVVMKQSDLGVLANGVREGRRTLANTLKYVYYTSASNFGNMLSMAVASLFLPFLPLLPKQILLNNLLSDLPVMAISADRVDEERVLRPGIWRTGNIRTFMVVFGTISSVFDGLTFVALLVLTGGSEAQFRTGWFLESLLTEILVLFVMRSRRPLGRSRPGNAMIALAAVVGATALAFPFTPLGRVFELEPLDPVLLGVVLAITFAYVLATELAKRAFFRWSAG
jgi:Mg2+-importing ATPase